MKEHTTASNTFMFVSATEFVTGGLEEHEYRLPEIPDLNVLQSDFNLGSHISRSQIIPTSEELSSLSRDELAALQYSWPRIRDLNFEGYHQVLKDEHHYDRSDIQRAEFFLKIFFTVRVIARKGESISPIGQYADELYHEIILSTPYFKEWAIEMVGSDLGHVSVDIGSFTSDRLEESKLRTITLVEKVFQLPSLTNRCAEEFLTFRGCDDGCGSISG